MQAHAEVGSIRTDSRTGDQPDSYTDSRTDEQPDGHADRRTDSSTDEHPDSRARLYDLDKFKTPKDKLRMPWFDLSEDEIHVISTFVLGLVQDEVGQAAMFPTEEQLAIDTGKRAVRQNNCASCHMIDPPTVTFLGDAGAEVTVQGEIQPVFLEDPLPPRMTSLEDLLADVQLSEEYMEEEGELDGSFFSTAPVLSELRAYAYLEHLAATARAMEE